MLSRLPPTPLPATPLPPAPCCCSTSHHFTSMGNLHKMQRWPGFILCIGRTPKKVCYAQKSMLRPGTRACFSHSLSFSLTLSLSFCVCVHGYFLFCINAPQASLSLSSSPACHRLPAPMSSAGRPARQHAVSFSLPPLCCLLQCCNCCCCCCGYCCCG